MQSYFHDGPIMAYLARSPEQTDEGLKKWDADGNFFKIAQMGPELPYWFSKSYAMNQSVYEVRLLRCLMTFYEQAKECVGLMLDVVELYNPCADATRFVYHAH